MRFYKSTSLLLGLLFLCSGLRAQVTDPSTLNQRLTQAMQEHFGTRSTEDPGAVLIVSQNGKEIYRQIFGTANLETGTRITDSTVFEAASVSKQFTAAAVLKLIDEGKLNLTDDIRTYFPELPDYGHTLTIRHLLTHTSGLRDWRNVVYLTPWPTGECLYNQDFALDMISKQRGINFTPGDQYRYSNSGYDLLASLVERITGESFAGYIKEHFLEPAGMTRSAIRGKYTDIVKNRANGYMTRNNRYLQGQTMDETYGAAGLQTTAADLQKWNAFIYSDKVSPSFKEMRLTQFVLNDGTEIPYANGGVEVHDHNGQMEVRHGGLISGYRAWVAYYPKTGFSVTYMSNDREISSSGTADAVADVLFGANPEPYADKKTKEISSDQLTDLSGKYRSLSDHSTLLDLKLQDGHLVRYSDTARIVGKDQFVLAKNLFIRSGENLKEYTQAGTLDYKKVEDFNPDAAALEAYTGSYYSPDCDVRFTLSVQDGKLVSARADYDKVTLFPQYRDGETVAFRCINNGLRNIYHFTRASDGSMHLKISIPRAADIEFTKQ